MAVDVPAPAELLLGRIFEVAPVGLGYVDAGGRFAHVNPALAAMNGVAVADHLGHTPTEVMGELGAPLEELVAEILATGEAVHGVELDEPTPPGRHFVAHYVPVSMAGEVRGVLAAVEDVTGRRDADRRGRALIEANVVGVVIATEDAILEANDAFLRMLGISREQFAREGLSWTAITPPRWAAIDAEKLAELRTRGAADPFEKEYLRADGSRVPILLGAVTLRREPLEVVAFVLDLTEREAALRAERAAREERDRILASIGEAFFALDGEGRFTYVNPRAEALLVRPRAELLGRGIWEAFPGAVGSPFWLQHQKAMDEGTAVEFEEFSPALGRWFAVRASPADEGFAVFLEDVTERRDLLVRERDAAARARALARVAGGLAAAVDAAEVARVAVEEARAVMGADAAALVQVEGGRLRLVHHLGYGERAALWDGQPLDCLPGPLPEAIADGKVVTVPSREQWRARYGEPPREMVNAAFAAVPLVVRRGPVGALGLAFAAPRSFAPEDEEMLLALARQVAQALDRARLYERMASIAHTLQQGLRPHRLPVLPGVELAVRYRPVGDAAGEVGGDFYDVFETGAGEWMVALGDVSGKGTEAAVLTGMARDTIRAVALREDDPSAVLALLNGAIRRHGDGERFCTVILGRLRADAGGLRVTLASGGHPPPLVLRAHGELAAIDLRGDLLGLFDVVTHEQVEVRLEPGDAILFYSDGITEARRGRELFGDARLRAAAAGAAGGGAEQIAAAVERTVRAFAPGLPRDDEALVVLRVSPRR